MRFLQRDRRRRTDATTSGPLARSLHSRSSAPKAKQTCHSALQIALQLRARSRRLKSPNASGRGAVEPGDSDLSGLRPWTLVSVGFGQRTRNVPADSVGGHTMSNEKARRPAGGHSFGCERLRHRNGVEPGRCSDRLRLEGRRGPERVTLRRISLGASSRHRSRDSRLQLGLSEIHDGRVRPILLGQLFEYV